MTKGNPGRVHVGFFIHRFCDEQTVEASALLLLLLLLPKVVLLAAGGGWPLPWKSESMEGASMEYTNSDWRPGCTVEVPFL